MSESVERLTRGKWRLTRRSLKQGTPNGKQVSSMLSELWGVREELFFQGDLCLYVSYVFQALGLGGPSSHQW